MNYLHHASKHITSSHYLAPKRKISNTIFILLLLGIAVLIFIIFKGVLGNILFSIRSLVTPSNSNEITLNPGAFESEVLALQVENEELKKLLTRSGVKVPNYNPQGDVIMLDDFENDNALRDSEPSDLQVDDSATYSSTTHATDTLDTVSNTATTGDEEYKKLDARKIKLEAGQVIAAVLIRPPQSPYDSLVINSGRNDGIDIGDQVYAFTGFPIGEIVNADDSRSTVKLFSAPGSKIEVLIGTSTTAAVAEGKGGGNFYLKLPKVSDIKAGDTVVRSYLSPEVFSAIESVDANDGEAYTYAYFKLPINLNSLVYVLVKKNPSR
jgi:hypothetical protein